MKKLLSVTTVLLASAFLVVMAIRSPIRGDVVAPIRNDKVPAQMAGTEITAKPGTLLPRDVRVVGKDGRALTTGDLLDDKDERPLLLVMAYYECPMLCSFVLNNLMEGMRGMELTTGRDYRTATVSFDPRDTPALAGKKQESYVQAYGRPVGDDGWRFFVGDEKETRRLADAIGFGYRWDEETKQFAHSAGAFIFTPDGRLSRVLFGIEFKPRDLQLALVEASEGRLGSMWDRLVLYCFHYDPGTGAYTIATMRILRVGAALTVGLLALLLVGFWRRELQGRPGGALPPALTHGQRVATAAPEGKVK